MPKKLWLGLILFSGLLLYQFSIFNVLQDDAFISFRYVKNFLAGHGLVFNVGERVEGYTNFLWIMLLALLTKIGLPLIDTARVLGIGFSVLTLGVATWGAYRYYPKRSWIWVLAVPFLLAANGSLAYWAGSGLETGLFIFLAASAAVTYLYSTPLSFLFLTLAALTRPEGALLAFLFGIIGVLLKQKTWKTTLQFWAALLLFLLPYAVFKYLYFGSLLPNPFYAKTGFSKEYWQSGVEYFLLFQKHYGLYGLVLLLPLIFWKKLSVFSCFCLLVFVGYSLYLVAIGGDVLKGHRFFVPMIMLFYFPAMDFLYQYSGKKWYRSLTFPLVVLLLAFYCYRVPVSYIQSEAVLKRDSNVKMAAFADFFKDYGQTKTFAVSAIGVLSCYLDQQRVIDMLGLTDPVISKNPEKIEGLVSTWKERNFNARYVLSQKPDVIIFTTGFKPSGLAERALFLYPDFRRNYRLEFIYQKGGFYLFYRRFQNLDAGLKPDYPASFVNLFNQAVNLMGVDNEKGIVAMRRSIELGPTDCSTLYSTLGSLYFLAGRLDSSEIYLKKGMELDGGGPVNRFYYSTLLYSQGRYAEADVQDSILVHTVPNAAELLKSVTIPVNSGQNPLDKP